MVYDEIKFRKNLQHETHKENGERPKVHHALRPESDQRKNFVVDLKDFIFCEFGKIIFELFIHCHRFENEKKFEGLTKISGFYSFQKENWWIGCHTDKMSINSDREQE